MSGQRYEYLLEGSVSPDILPQLIVRLQSITDQVFKDGSAILEHERIYTLKGSGNSNVTVYCRRSLSDKSAPWQLRYLGLTETSTGQSQDKRRVVSMRSCIMSSIEGNCFKFLEDLGFRKCNEHVLKGHFFVKNNVSITVAQVFKIEAGGTQSTVPVSWSSLVTARLLAPSGSTSAVDQLYSVADMLKPLVGLSKAS